MSNDLNKYIIYGFNIGFQTKFQLFWNLMDCEVMAQKEEKEILSAYHYLWTFFGRNRCSIN